MTKDPKLAGFDPQVEKRLCDFIKNSPPGIAVFDADGTLWHGDLGEYFFQDQIRTKTLSSPPTGVSLDKLWDFYWQETLTGDATKAYGWLAQWNLGISEEDLSKQCREFFDAHWKSRIFKPMHQLTAALKDAGFEIWVVSGSLKWAVQAGVRHFGIPPERVIGASVDVENGVLTDRIAHGIVPYRAGKAKLIKKLIPTSPVFGSGNTFWDKELLETVTSKGLGLVISSEKAGEVNYKSEQELKAMAPKKGWLTQEFAGSVSLHKN